MMIVQEIKSIKSILIFTSMISILFLLAGCAPSAADLTVVDYTPLVRDDWPVSTPEEQGLDSLLVAEMYLNAAELETLYSLLVIKNGHLVAEDYFNEGSVEQKDRLQSVTKSFTSALVGIALEQGCLSSVDQKLVDFFPEVADEITDPRKEQITVRNLLEMRGGYPNEEDAQVLWDGLLSGHYPPLIEDFPLVDDPGTKFHYSNLSSNWLGIIVDRSCGMNLKAYAEENLFSHLDVEPGEWGQDAEGHNNGCGDLHLAARDAAKFGLLYLNDGVFDGNQIIPSDWVEDSLQTYSVNEAFVKKVGDFHDIGYGYQWWSATAGEHDVNFAWGHGGQLIVLVEDLDMVVVTTSYPFWLEHNDQSWKHEKAIINLVADFITSLPSQ
ncbi:MAG: serine hydrolase [Ardenticatenaceae bacterium]|nr:serine hydrolase [Ardenticatenaceae bacterium]MCB9445975.1 serine hydrolase [Ardenticatenaceae bacterium]